MKVKNYNNRLVIDVDNAKDGVIQVIPIADVHLGNEQFDLTYFKAVVDYIEQTDNALFLLNGDLIENTIVGRVPASVFNDTLSPINQITMVSTYLEPIVAQGKCINATLGNHEKRSSKDVGINPMDMIVSNLTKYDEDLPKKYYPSGVFTFLNIPYHKHGNKRETYATILLYNQHGTNGGTTLQGAVGSSVKLDKATQDIADIVIRSHTHKAYAIPVKHLRANYNSYDIYEDKGWLVSNGAFINYWNGYGQMAGYEIQDNSTPIITIQVNRKRKGKIEYVSKLINVEMKSKDWFLEQVRK